MFSRINTGNYFLYNNEEKSYYLREAANYYLEKYVSRENENVYYVGVQELKLFFNIQEINAVEQERYEDAEIYKKLGIIYDNILEKIKKEIDGL